MFKVIRPLGVSLVLLGTIVPVTAGANPDLWRPSDPLHQDAAAVARSFGISYDEAVALLMDEQNFAAFLEDASVRFDDFAGAWSSPEHGHVVLFKGHGDTEVVAQLATEYKVRITIVWDTKYSEADLQEISDDAVRALTDAGLDFGASVSVRDQKVIVTIAGSAEEAATVLAEYAGSPALELRSGPPTNDSLFYVHGGAAMVKLVGGQWKLNCTTGFTASFVDPNIGTSTQGYVSAGHCDDSQKYENPFTGVLSPTSIERIHEGAYGDMGFYEMGTEGMEPSFFASPGQVRFVLSVRSAGAFAQGQTVCMYGRKTNQAVCGTIRDTSHACLGMQRLVVMNQLLGDFGDSGGPWYHLNTAVGMVTGACTVDGALRAVFTKATYVSRSDTIDSDIMLD